MTDWFARPVLHVTDVETSLRFYVDRLGFTCLWRDDEDGVAMARGPSHAARAFAEDRHAVTSRRTCS